MKKTLIALGGAVVLLAIALFFDRHRDAVNQSDRFAFDTTQKTNMDHLKVVLQKDTAVLVKKEGRWVASPDDFPVDTGKIAKGLASLIGMQNKEIVSSNPSRLVEYGLDSNQAKHVEWRVAGGDPVQVVLGKTSGADYSSTYWKWEDKSEVYSTPGSFTWDISARISDWKDRNLFKMDARDIKDLEVDWRDSLDHPIHYKLEAVNDSTVRMLAPDSTVVKKNEATSLLAQCGQFSIDDFVDAKDTDLARVRIDTPMVAVRIGLKSGKSYEIKGGRTFNSMVYTLHPFRKDIVKVAEWRFKPFEKQPYELMADTVLAKAAMPPEMRKPSNPKKATGKKKH